MDVNTALMRAASGLGKVTTYASPGHLPPFAATTFPDHGKLDCSGFIYWCLRFPSNPPESRMVDHPLYKKTNGGWFETTAIYADGQASTGYFTQIELIVGALLVYPDHRGADGKKHDGHIGIVTAIDPTKSGLARVSKIIHCSFSGWTKKGDAVQETGPDPWLSQSASIAVWYDGFTDAGTQKAATPLAASPGGAKELAAKPANYRSLTPGGVFSKNPFDLAVPRSIRTNNPGALNVTDWQKAYPGYVDKTIADHAGNQTSIYVTPEHGIAAWHYLLTNRYGYGEGGAVELQDLARRYAGVHDPADPAAQAYVKGWKKWSKSLSPTSRLVLTDDADMISLAHGMFGHEAGASSLLHDDQIAMALSLKRSGKLPPN